MTNKINEKRRQFIKSAGLGSGLLASSIGLSALGFSKLGQAMASKPPIGRVVIIGGGYAGATAAKYIRMWSLGNIETIVIEKSSQFVSCPLSNLVLGGSKEINSLTFGYNLLKKNHGIQWVNDEVVAIDSQQKIVKMQRASLHYDRLIIAPGIDFNYAQFPQLAHMQAHIPHAWKAGTQTVNLRKQLETMPDGGIFVMTIPKAPYRCPPGPYERACQVANYFKMHKPKSKVVILDANPEITSKKGLFTNVFNTLYADMIDYRPNNEIISIDANTKTVKADFDTIKADVLNVIPPQLAGKPAQMLALNNIDNRWCEVDFLTYESKIEPNVHVIGDSVSAGLPKSAHMATSQAKVCASAIVELMAGNPPDSTPVFANTCYSYIDGQQAIHVANVYRYDSVKKVMVAAEGGGVSIKPSLEEGIFAKAWADNIWADVLT